MSILEPGGAYPRLPLNVITTRWLKLVKSIRDPSKLGQKLSCLSSTLALSTIARLGN